MTIPNMTEKEFLAMNPESLFLWATNYIYQARKDGRIDDIGELLSVFDGEARRALLVGSSALLAMAPGPYREALESSLAKSFYEHWRKAK